MELFSGVSQKCVDCHSQPASHKGVFEASCDQCHNPAGWQPAKLDGKQFDHEVNTSFSLDHHRTDYQEQPISCSYCHPGGFSSADLASCATCHSGQDAGFMQQHTSQYGPACLECHDGRDRMRTFDHSAVFPLEAAHSRIACLECHKGGFYHTAQPRCADCHSEPAIHLGFFGLECQECHTSTAWSPAYLREHSFPLNHGEQGQVACQTCHTASYTEYTCYGCHDHQPEQIAGEHIEKGVSASDLPNCTKCHPTGREKEGD
jgi:Cytochrome c3